LTFPADLASYSMEMTNRHKGGLLSNLHPENGEAMDEVEAPESEPLYCPTCEREVDDPLVCGDCAAVICRRCGTPLEKVDELGIG
jgi:hypothetical protein